MSQKCRGGRREKKKAKAFDLQNPLLQTANKTPGFLTGLGHVSDLLFFLHKINFAHFNSYSQLFV